MKKSRSGALRALAAGALLVAGAAGATAQQETAPDQSPANGARGPVVLGGGVPFGLYFPLAGAICRLLEGEGHGCVVAPLSDSEAAIEALQRAEVQLALVQSDWLAHAVAGTSRFSEAGPAETLRAVAALHGEGLVILVRDGDGIDAPEALEGARLSRGPDESSRPVLGSIARC